MEVNSRKDALELGLKRFFNGEWHIDHIQAISKLINPGVIDPAVINALDNLQPLWAKDNMTKGNSLESSEFNYCLYTLWERLLDLTKYYLF